MSIGEKIFELRKKNGLNQEELAEKLDVTRQTISNWELNQTSPTIEQARNLAKYFNISLDELTNNDINSIMVKKVSNREKLAGLIIKILMFMIISSLVLFIIVILGFSLFTFRKGDNNNNKQTTVVSFELNCSLNNEKYFISVSQNDHFDCDNCDNNLKEELSKLIDIDDLEKTRTEIENHFINLDGNCN